MGVAWRMGMLSNEYSNAFHRFQTMSSCLLLLFMTIHMAVSVEDLLAGVECDHDPVGYIIPDPLYCDR